MNKAVHRKRKKKGPVIAEFKRRRVLVRKGGPAILMDCWDRQRELKAAGPTVGQVEYLRKIADAADRHMIRAQDTIDIISLAVTNPDFGKGRIGGDTIAAQLAIVIDEIEAIRSVLFTREVCHVGN